MNSESLKPNFSDLQSEQVTQKILAPGLGVGAAVPISMENKVVTQIATKAAKQALNPVSKILINVGVKQAPKVVRRAAAGIAGVGGIVSGLAADRVVGTMLQDDEHLPQQEHEARQTGRIAGQVASTVGAIGGRIAAATVGAIGGRIAAATVRAIRGRIAAATVGGGAAVAAAVAATAVLGIAIAFGVYHLKGEGLLLLLKWVVAWLLRLLWLQPHY